MKNLKLLFILVILSIYITEEQETCSSNFDTNLPRKCSSIDSDCKTDVDGLGCFRRGCSNAKDQTYCGKTLPDDHHINYCYWDSTEKVCKQKKKTCGQYNRFGGKSISNGGDECSKLEASTGYSCVLISEDTCIERLASFDSGNSMNCGSIELADNSLKCLWGIPPGSTGPVKCYSTKKGCSEGIFYFGGENKNICKDLNPTSTQMTCIYFKGKCKEVKPTCGEFNDETSCNSFTEDFIPYDNMPVNGNVYDLSKKCFWDKKTSACVTKTRKCDDYNPDIDFEICENLQPTNPTIQECVKEGGVCLEKYKTCNDYSDNTLDKDRNHCETSLSSIDTNDKCEFILGQDKCQKKETTYTSCSDYNSKEEKDKVICESIKTQNHPYYCVLDKDSECRERELNCSEVYTEGDCLNIAKSNDPNKKCAFKSGECYEEYIRCEDFFETITSTDQCTTPSPSTSSSCSFQTKCEGIILYNGLKCEYVPNPDRCRSRKKVCAEAQTKEECKLIAKTGVSDPDRKVCHYFDTSDKCEEVFKYCSDYRLGDRTECEKIKPYNPDGETIDDLSKCVFEQGEIQKCQKVPKDCFNANGNPILCAKISDSGKIKDKNLKYCRYNKDNNLCESTFKYCESYKETNKKGDNIGDINNYNEHEEACKNIIPLNYESGSCSYELDDSDNKFKCVLSKECSLFDSNDVRKMELCKLFKPDCKYDSTSKTCEQDKEKECEDIIFYSGTEEDNKKYCEDMAASKPYMICTLKEDKSGCEEIYRELSFSTAASSYKEPPGSESLESSDMIRGIQLLMIILCLLF